MDPDLAVELQQTTQAIQAQARDSITEKQMMFTEWIGTDLTVADLFRRGSDLGYEALSSSDVIRFQLLVHGILREWEEFILPIPTGPLHGW